MHLLKNRDLVNCNEWNNLLDKCGLDSRCTSTTKFEDGYDNETFSLSPYSWADCDCVGWDAYDSSDDVDVDTFIASHKEGCPQVIPNFHYKPTGFKIYWYKYPFRATDMSHDLSDEEIKKIWQQCADSIKQDAWGTKG